MKKNLIICITAGLTLAAFLSGCGKSAESAPTEAPVAEETSKEAADSGAGDTGAAGSYDPASFDPSEVYAAPDQVSSIDITGCDTFTQIVEGLGEGNAYANVTLGDTDVLMITGDTYEWDPGVNAGLDAEIFYYKDGTPAYLATVACGGTADPLAVKDGNLYIGTHHSILKCTVDTGNYMTLEEAYVQYDPEGNDTYYYKTCNSQFEDWSREDAKSRFDELFDEKNEAEVISFQTVGGEAAATGGALPAYDYPGPELFYTVLYKYLIDEYSGGYPAADVSIPCPVIIKEDESDKSDIKVYANFWIFNYDLKGDTLECASGGSYPGCMHLKSTDEGYEVTSMDVVEDGSGYTDSAKKIFGDCYDDFVKSGEDEKTREDLRAQIIANYVAANNLDIKAYKDYGWDPVTLPEENIDNFYSILD